MRCAIIFTPPYDDPLYRAASAWLRRDIYTGAALDTAVEGLTERDHAFITALPRRFGFHAALKAPFGLAEGKTVSDIERHLAHFCAGLEPVALAPRLGVSGNTYALTAARNAEIDMLAARTVTEFDTFRAAESEETLLRRAGSGLTGRQLANLMMWGEPAVFDQFRFHMPLTGPVDSRERDHVAVVLARYFGELGSLPLSVSQLCLSIAPDPFSPFLIHSAHRFGVQSQRRTG